MKDNIGDYAFPAMMAEQALKDVHYGIIDQEPEKARKAALDLFIQAALLHRWVEEWVDLKQK